MADDTRTPVVIGVGDCVNRSRKVDDAREPLELILAALKTAIEDSGVDQDALTKSIDSISVVRTWTWPYPDLSASVAARLGISPQHLANGEHGGNTPALLLDEAARRVSKGQSKIAIVAGAEALASLAACAAEGHLPPPGWTKVDQDVSSVFSPTTRDLKPDLGALHSIGNPIHIYPLYENGLRAHRGQSISDNNTESAKLYGQFSEIAASNANAWSYGKKPTTAEQIGTVSKQNRMICLPYPLLMNAFNNVNMAAVTIVTSVAVAKQLNVLQSKWIYPLGGAGTKDSDDFWLRPNYFSSPSISQSLDAALTVSNVKTADIDLFDFYSCFPIVPKLACEHLGLSTLQPRKPLSLLGGLTSFGGAGNNYALHAVTEMVRQLRAGHGSTGLVLANGGWVTYQHVVLLSRSPRKSGSPYPKENPLPPTTKDRAPRVVEQATGDATIETYTVEFQRDGKPGLGHVVGRLHDGSRFIANHADQATLDALCSPDKEPIGQKGVVSTGSDGRNLFRIKHEIASRL